MPARIALIRELAATLLHDLNNPLASLLVNLEMLEAEGASLSEEGRDSLRDARAAADQLRFAIDTASGFARAHEPDARLDIVTALRIASVLASSDHGCPGAVIDTTTRAVVRKSAGAVVQSLVLAISHAARARAADALNARVADDGDAVTVTIEAEGAAYDAALELPTALREIARELGGEVTTTASGGVALRLPRE